MHCAQLESDCGPPAATTASDCISPNCVDSSWANSGRPDVATPFDVQEERATSYSAVRVTGRAPLGALGIRALSRSTKSKPSEAGGVPVIAQVSAYGPVTVRVVAPAYIERSAAG